jgi:transcriptional regulator with XRE-family HTH domain
VSRALGKFFMTTFNERLKLLRKQKNLTQVNMAEVLNITDRQYQLYEYGKSFPEFKGLLFIADYFDVSLDYLTGRSDDPERK